MNFNGINFNRIGFSGKVKFDSQANKQNSEVSCFTNILNNTVNKPSVAKYAIPQDENKPETPSVAKYAIPQNVEKPETPPVTRYSIPQENPEPKKTMLNDLLF